MTFLLEKMERANAVSGSKYLTDCIAAIKSLEASIKGDDFDEHAKNITTALGLMPRMFIGDYFPVKRGTEFPDMCFHFSNGKIMKKTMPQDFLLQQMEWREELETHTKNKEALEKLASVVAFKKNQKIDLLPTYFDKKNNLPEAIKITRELNFIEKIEQHISDALIEIS